MIYFALLNKWLNSQKKGRLLFNTDHWTFVDMFFIPPSVMSDLSQEVPECRGHDFFHLSHTQNSPENWKLSKYFKE